MEVKELLIKNNVSILHESVKEDDTKIYVDIEFKVGILKERKYSGIMAKHRDEDSENKGRAICAMRGVEYYPPKDRALHHAYGSIADNLEKEFDLLY